MNTNTTEKEYTREQNGFLAQELISVLTDIRPKASETEKELLDVIAMTFMLSRHGVSNYDIERVTELLKRYQNECKIARIAELEKELTQLKGVTQ